MTKKEFTAIKAVVYGCRENTRIKGKKFVLYSNDGETVEIKDTIPFEEAVEIVCNFIEKESKKKNGK